MMGISRTRSAGAKVTEQEYAQLEALAQTRGLTLGEWCRDVLPLDCKTQVKLALFPAFALSENDEVMRPQQLSHQRRDN
jgi:hypothetical protein